MFPSRKFCSKSGTCWKREGMLIVLHKPPWYRVVARKLLIGQAWFNILGENDANDSLSRSNSYNPDQGWTWFLSQDSSKAFKTSWPHWAEEWCLSINACCWSLPKVEGDPTSKVERHKWRHLQRVRLRRSSRARLQKSSDAGKIQSMLPKSPTQWRL